MRRWGLLGFVLAALSVAAAGFVRWPVTDWVQTSFGHLELAGWQVQVGQAGWMPWRDLELTDVRLRSPQGGRIHGVKVSIRPDVGTLLTGRVRTLWDLGPLRVDPGSWGIREPLAVEILSSGPVTTHGKGRVRFGQGRVDVEGLNFQGQFLRVSLRGGLGPGSAREFHLVCSVQRDLVGAMGFPVLDSARPDPWEYFNVRWDGSRTPPKLEINWERKP